MTRSRRVGHAAGLAVWLAVGLPAFGGVTAVARPALAQTGDVVLENLSFKLEAVTYRAPRVEVRGTPLSRDDLLGLLDGPGTDDRSARLLRLQARDIAMPELVAESDLPGGRQRTVYRDVHLLGVEGGRIETASATGGSFEATGTGGTTSGGFGRFSMAGIDAAAAAALYGPGAADAAGPPRPVYESFSLRGLTVSDGRGSSTAIDEIAGRGFAARATPEGWTGTIAILAARGPDADVPEARKRRSRALADLLDSVSVGSLEVRGLVVAADDGSSGRMARMAFNGTTPAAGKAGERGSSLSIETLEAGNPSAGTIRIGSAEITGLSLASTLAALRTETVGPDGKLDGAGARRLLPTVDRLAVSDVELAPPEPSAAGLAAFPRVRVGQFSLASGTPPAGDAAPDLTGRVTLGLRDLRFPVAGDSDNALLQQLAALGYSDVDASLAADLGWKEGTKEFAIRELSFDGRGLGSVVLRGLFGNVSPDILDQNRETASIALLRVGAKHLDIGLEDRGLLGRVLGLVARRDGSTPDAVRQGYAATAAIGIPAMLGGSAAANALGSAVSRFIARPHRLLITVRAKDPGGFGIADYAARPAPSAILDQLEITAQAD